LSYSLPQTTKWSFEATLRAGFLARRFREKLRRAMQPPEPSGPLPLGLWGAMTHHRPRTQSAKLRTEFSFQLQMLCGFGQSREFLHGRRSIARNGVVRLAPRPCRPDLWARRYGRDCRREGCDTGPPVELFCLEGRGERNAECLRGSPSQGSSRGKLHFH
jgi:hypothetical protein